MSFLAALFGFCVANIIWNSIICPREEYPDY